MRLLALSRAHDVLTRENWVGADLTDVVARALEPYGIPGRSAAARDGTAVRVTPRMSLALAMALHELATNAVKYGALSNKVGTVARFVEPVERRLAGAAYPALGGERRPTCREPAAARLRVAPDRA